MSDTPYLTPADLKNDPNLMVLVNVDDGYLADLIEEFEEIAESYRGVAFTTRTVTGETCFVQTDVPFAAPGYSFAGYGMLSGRVHAGITLSHPKIIAVTAMTVQDSSGAVTVQDLTKLNVDSQAGAVYSPFGFYPGTTVSIDYTHGFQTPPKALLRACRQYVRGVATRDGSGVPRDAIGQRFDDGSYIRYSTPDASAGRPTGYLEVDRLLNTLPDYTICGVG